MTAIYRQAGSLFAFPFSTKDQWGRLADVTTQGDFVLFSDDVSQGVVPAAAIEFTHEATGLYVARVDSANEELLAQVDAGCFDQGRILTGAMTEIVADEVEHLGDYLPRTYIVGVAPGSSGNGPNLVTITVTNAANDEPIPGQQVTVYDANGYYAGVGTSDANGEVPLRLHPGVYSPAVNDPGVWQMADPTQTFTVASAPLAVTVPLEAFAIPPSDDPDTLTLAVYAMQRNEAGDGFEPAGAGVVMHVQITDSDQDGLTVVNPVLTATTGADSRAYFTNFPRSSRYKAWQANATYQKKDDRTPDTGDSHELPFTVGGTS